MVKRIVGLLMSVLLVVILPLTSFAADRTQKSYWVDFFNNGGEVTAEMARTMTAEENNARMDALVELNAQAAAASTADAAAALTEDAKAIIARIKENYNITVELGYNGDYPANAKVTQHLQGIEAGMSYLGASFIKKLVKSVEDTQGLPFQLQLVPRLDTKSVSGALETSWAVAGAGGITFYGYDSSPFSAPTVVHEFGHVLEHAVRGSAGKAPAPFGDLSGIVREKAADGSSYVKSVPYDKFVSNYAGKNAAEDYVESFRVVVVGGTKNPYKGGKDTILYKKFKVIYDDLLKFAGADSRATQRVGGYLGLVP